MKQILLFFLLVTTYTLQGQTGNGFKNVLKKTANTTKNNLNARKITGKSNLKSSAVSSSKNNFSVSKNLKTPSLNLDKIPRFFEKEKSSLKSINSQSSKEQFYSFHNSSKQTTLLSDPENQLKITKSYTDKLGITHVKAQQYYKGVKVHGAESFVHLGSKKDVFNGNIYKILNTINTIPNISKTEALNIINIDLATKTVLKNLSEKHKEILEYTGPQIDLAIYENKLVYEVLIRPNFIQEWKYFIDANTGQIINDYDNTHSDGPTTATAYDLNNVLRTIDTYLENGDYLLLNTSENMYNSSSQEGIILTLDANNTSSANLDYTYITSSNNTWSNKTAISAHFNATETYKYFENTFGRNSLNDQGGNIISFINVTNEDGSSMENAFWNGKTAFYGNGGASFYPLAGALDVIAHELGHGVISNTANLEYQGQSGAINESYADIFGAMVDRDDWQIGEDVVKTSTFPSGTMRNMSDPHNSGSSNDFYWQPKHTSEMYLGEQDYGGVHINSGITNYAYYLYSNAITKEKAEQVFYRALTNYLTSKSQFIDLRIAIIQSAKDLYGDNSTEVNAAKTAFDAVGIYEEEVIDYSQNYPVNPGEEYLLTYDINTTDINTLYSSTTTGTNFNALSTTQMKRPVSVTDDGVEAVFVTTNDKIKVINIDPNNIQEYELTDNPFFDNVAISKDGNRLAAISTEVDNAIYVYDFISQQWSTFTLYNPTTSENVTGSGGVLYADAIEFDHTGEYLIYDAFNQLNSTNNTDISYWDIGFIKVWNNTTDQFGDGTINKLYGSLPENVSIGNPTFSKNSPDIIAFDYLDSNTNKFAIFGANLLTGNLSVITTNTTIGFPTFSKNDDQIAYSTLNTNNEEVVATIALSSNKITASSSPSVIIADAKWPVFYTLGTRDLGLKPVANFSADNKEGEAPFNVKFIDLSANSPTSWSWTFEGGTPATSTLENPTITYNSVGNYKVTLTSANEAGNNTITKNSYISVLENSLGVVGLEKELISFYPNPNSGVLHITTEEQFVLEIYSISGMLLLKSENEKNVDLSNINSGIYILKLKVDNRIFTNKIIKK